MSFWQHWAWETTCGVVSSRVFSARSFRVDFNVLFTSMEDRCAVSRSCSVFGVFNMSRHIPAFYLVFWAALFFVGVRFSKVGNSSRQCLMYCVKTRISQWENANRWHMNLDYGQYKTFNWHFKTPYVYWNFTSILLSTIIVVISMCHCCVTGFKMGSSKFLADSRIIMRNYVRRLNLRCSSTAVPVAHWQESSPMLYAEQEEIHSSLEGHGFNWLTRTSKGYLLSFFLTTCPLLRQVLIPIKPRLLIGWGL